MFDLLAFLLVSRIIIWTLMKTPLLHFLRQKYQLIDELLSCDFCIGFWVCLVLAVPLGINFFNTHPIVGIPLTAISSSFILHIFVKGLVAEFSTIVME